MSKDNVSLATASVAAVTTTNNKEVDDDDNTETPQFQAQSHALTETREKTELESVASADEEHLDAAGEGSEKGSERDGLNSEKDTHNVFFKATASNSSSFLVNSSGIKPVAITTANAAEANDRKDVSDQPVKKRKRRSKLQIQMDHERLQREREVAALIRAEAIRQKEKERDKEREKERDLLIEKEKAKEKEKEISVAEFLSAFGKEKKRKQSTGKDNIL